MVLFRRMLGEVLRGARRQRGMTLRELSAEARVSLGYISEIERGQKEASSELLASLCQAMDLPLSSVLREVSDAVAVEEALLGGAVLSDAALSTSRGAPLASSLGDATSTPITAARPAGEVVASAA